MAGLELFSFTQQLLEISMRVRAARHEVLSANIANVDTPGYRARDLDFRSIIKSALEIGEPSVDRSARQLRPPTSVDLRSAIYEPEFPDDRHGEERLDGNNVSLDGQIAMLTQNALAYETSLTLLARKLAGLRYAISEGRR